MGKSANNVSREIKEQSKLSKEEWRKYFTGHWNFAGEKQNGHLAMFPEELPRRLIKMFSFIGETILDPFLGSGTTTKAARNLERNSIGYEINRNYLPIIKQKLGINKPSFFDISQKYEIIFQEKKNTLRKIELKKALKDKGAINNRINNPDYWKIIRYKKRVGVNF